MTTILSSRKPLFWILAVAFSAAGIWFAIKNYSVAFPIAQVNISFSRKEAIDEAQKICDQQHVGPKDGYRHAASFESDDATQLYVELEAGGSTAFNQMVTGTIFTPYTWHIRHFVEYDPHEVTVILKPDGTHYGFIEKISEQAPGPALSVEEAKKLAEAATHQWNISAEYRLVETSKETRHNGRIDHTFTYELPEKIGEGRYRYQIVVSGDRVTTVKPFVKVPESFYKHYSALRSGNQTIRQVAVILVLLLYLLIGCYGGLFYLLRRGQVIWQQPIFWALLISSLVALDGFNELPLKWMKYDTATSVNNFLFTQCAAIFIQFMENLLVLLLVSFIVAEGFTRLAFGNKIQFWRSWSKDVAGSSAILGQTLGGYLIVGTELGFSMVLFYIIARNYFGWWVPSQTLVDPNVLARYVPWLHPIAQSLQAGFWEECLFRAVPLAGAALIGQRFGYRNLCIGVAMIIQTIIFGAGHAHYAAEPAYARVVELIVPSLIFGALYLMYGLLPVIIAHFTYDTVLIALPIFISHAHGSWIDKALVIAIGFIPLWIVLYRRFQHGRWSAIPADAYNKAYVPAEHKVRESAAALPPHSPWLARFGTPTIVAASILCVVAAVAAWALLTRFSHDETPLRVTRDQAVLIAKDELAKHNVHHPDWEVLATVHGDPQKEDRYIWQQFCRPLYRELLNDFYLMPPRWEVRFATWHGALADRAEEYRVCIARDGSVIRYLHILPQHTPGASLSEDEASELAKKALQNPQYGVKEFTQVAAESEKEPARMDWKLTFEHALGNTSCAQHNHEQPRLRVDVKVGGNEVTDIKRYLFVPEKWKRSDTDNEQLRKGIEHLVALFGYLLIGVAALFAFITFQWSGRFVLAATALLFGLAAFNIANIYDILAFRLETSQPITEQLLRTLGLLSVLTLILTLLQAFVLAWYFKVGRSDHKIKFQHRTLAAALGALCAALVSWMDRISNCCVPAWAQYTTAGLVWPVPGTAVHVIDLFFATIVKLAAWALLCNTIWSFAASRGKKVVAYGCIALLTVLTALVLAEPALSHDVTGWVVGTIGFSIILSLGYYILYRYDLRMLIPTAAMFVIITQIKQLKLDAFPGARLGGQCGIIMLVLIADGMVYLLRKRE